MQLGGWSQCDSCGSLHDCSPGFWCIWCGGRLGPVSPDAEQLLRRVYGGPGDGRVDPAAVEALEDPDRRPYLWDLEV